jgi:hypothetical protein
MKGGVIDVRSVNGFGDAGEINLNIKQLWLENGARLRANSGHFSGANPLFSGNAGGIRIAAEQAIILRNSALTANLFSGGQAQTIMIDSPVLLLEQSTIQNATVGFQAAGDLKINAQYIQLKNNSFLTVESSGEALAEAILN